MNKNKDGLCVVEEFEDKDYGARMEMKFMKMLCFI
jgi:hypothetical protein